MRDTTGKYQLFSGTSAAAPYAAGVVALLLQENPKLSIEAIKELLTLCATEDKFTGPVPNTAWGHGKLDVEAIGKMIKKAAPSR